MTLWALLSDIHGRGDRLARVLADLQVQRLARPGVEVRVLALGDIASPQALSQLDRAGALCVFGNWEASGLRGLPPPFRSWVSRWPAVLQVDGFVVAHATPVWPSGLAIGGVVEHLRARSLHWTHLFPSLQHSESGRTAAFSALKASGSSLFFHGHTHVQEAWRLVEGQAARRIEYAATEGGVLQLELAEAAEPAHWLVGVGSVGDPHDGPGAHYALYDTAARQLIWRRV
jgi:predicted phosphodiesterase